jgi:hypothetical protein
MRVIFLGYFEADGLSRSHDTQTLSWNAQCRSAIFECRTGKLLAYQQVHLRQRREIAFDVR